MSAATVWIPAAEEMRLATGVLAAFGVPVADAEIQARWLVEADRRGHGSHGLQRLPLLARRLESGLARPVAQPTLDWRTGAVLAVDGNRGLGPVVAMRALEHAEHRIGESGVVLIAISNANHLGMLAPYVEWLCGRGRLGLALTTTEALVHPWGGRRAMVGTNPIALGVPADPRPLVVDLATGTVSMGKIIRHGELGAPLEPGWALDAEGRPTLDAAAAVDGAISPFGGAKGYALGLALEVFVGALTESALGRDVKGTLDAEAVCNKGDVFFCVDPDRLGGPGGRARISAYLAALQQEPAQDRVERVRLPGERAAGAQAKSEERGVELPGRVWDAARALAERLGVGLAADAAGREVPTTVSQPLFTE